MSTYTISDQQAWDSIQTGIHLCKPLHPHIESIVLTPEQKQTLIKLYRNKRFVVYCAKFEEYFKINQEYVRREPTPAECNEGTGNVRHNQVPDDSVS